MGKWLQKLLGVDRIIAHQKHTHALLRWQIDAIIAIHQHHNSKHCSPETFTFRMPVLHEPKEKQNNG